MAINLDPVNSCNELLLYEGELTLLPHQGIPRPGRGTIELACGAGTRHLRVRFRYDNEETRSELPASRDGKYGRGTTMMRAAPLGDFFVFVTSGGGPVTGESQIIRSSVSARCDHFDVYLLNCLVPMRDMVLSLGEWRLVVERTRCAYDLTRVSLPTQEINLTHKVTITQANGASFFWNDIDDPIGKLVQFLSFANSSRVQAPVIYGFERGELQFVQYKAPERSVPTNRRSWCTELTQSDVSSAMSRYMSKTSEEFWAEVLHREAEWQVLADAAAYDSADQALFIVQMLLELLSYVLLVEDAGIIGEAGYSKLPASDRITLLCSRSAQSVSLPQSADEKTRAFCGANNIGNVGELIAALRNKLTHPTKRNRDYLEKVPNSARWLAIVWGQQIAALTILKAIGYNGMYFDVVEHQLKLVPWAN
jgi:hypothetical protein